MISRLKFNWYRTRAVLCYTVNWKDYDVMSSLRSTNNIHAFSYSFLSQHFNAEGGKKLVVSIFSLMFLYFQYIYINFVHKRISNNPNNQKQSKMILY